MSFYSFNILEYMIKGRSILNEWPDGNVMDVNSATKPNSQIKQELTGKISETKSTDSSKPNPQKAPLNYIENMGEWEKAKKELWELIEKIKVEVALALTEYEDKLNEIDRFKEEKTNLEKDLIKIMALISHKFIDYDDFLDWIFSKIDENSSEWDYSDIVQWTYTNPIESEEISEEITQVPSKENEEWSESPQITKITRIIVSGENAEKVLKSLWIPTQPETSKEFIDEVAEVIGRFLFLVDTKNRKENSKLLKKKEIIKVKKLYSMLKKDLSKYLDLIYQIELITSKIDKLEGEKNGISVKYNGLNERLEKTIEESQELDKTYFLNSYLSTKNLSLENFVTSPIVQKQITNIVEANKKWLQLPKTILLYGKPNLGKTYAANVLASELWRKMYHIKSYDIFTWWFSDPNIMLDTIFKSAIDKKEPCIIFLDEIESFIWWYAWSPYQNLIENTIRHHISKIKESDAVDIIIIWAISEKNKISPSLLKQDVFSKQIYFDDLPENRCVDFINKLAAENSVTIWSDVDVAKLVSSLKDHDRNQEYIKKLMNIAIDSHKLNSWEEDNSVLSMQDFDEALKVMLDYSRSTSQNVWF